MNELACDQCWLRHALDVRARWSWKIRPTDAGSVMGIVVYGCDAHVPQTRVEALTELTPGDDSDAWADCELAEFIERLDAAMEASNEAAS